MEVYLKIPNRKEYYNKKYQAVIEVKTKKNRPDEIFVLVCQMKITFTTSPIDKKQTLPQPLGAQKPKKSNCTEDSCR